MTIKELSECIDYDVLVELDGSKNVLARLVIKPEERPYLEWPLSSPFSGSWPTPPKISLSDVDIASLKIVSNKAISSLIRLSADEMKRLP